MFTVNILIFSGLCGTNGILVQSTGVSLGRVSPTTTESVRTATKKAGGTVTNTADSPGQRLGIKRYAGELVRTGHILVRQRGRLYIPGMNVLSSKDYTLHSLIDGKVVFTHMPLINKSKKKTRCFVNVLPREEKTDEPLVQWMADYVKKYNDSQKWKAYKKDQSNRTNNPAPPIDFPPKLSY